VAITITYVIVGLLVVAIGNQLRATRVEPDVAVAPAG
jgi:uncharacterized membrane-anchored protein